MPAPKVSETTTDQTLLGRRDAFHVPGVLVSSKYIVNPGQDVWFTDASCTQVVPALLFEREAIADPFVARINVGDLFWVFLIPDITGNLTHTFDIKRKEPVVEPEVEPEVTSEILIAKLKDEIADLNRRLDDMGDEDDGCRGCY